MGYHTELEGKFEISPPLNSEQLAYLQKFCTTRRMKRDELMLKNIPDPLREAVGLPIGQDGEFYVGGKAWFEKGSDQDPTIINRNHVPHNQPGFNCPWVPSDDGYFLTWDNMERPSNYVKWLQYIIDIFFNQWKKKLDGRVKWKGEDPGDFGTIVINENKIELFGPIFINDSAGNRRKLRVFLCHASSDKEIVRDLYRRLKDQLIEPWLDEEDLVPGQDWKLEIKKAVRSSDLVVVCLSKQSVSKIGFVQKEIKYALDVADKQPEGSIYIIPTKLEECDVPHRLEQWHWVTLFEKNGLYNLLRAFAARANYLSSL